MQSLRVETWSITAPAAGTRDPLVVMFPAPLDHGLLQRALGVSQGTTPMTGEIAIGREEREWRFTPTSNWTRGDYALIVLSILEDPMGNRIGRPFDVDRFDQIDKTPTAERITRAFTVR
jgi:hypothetical protein